MVDDDGPDLDRSWSRAWSELVRGVNDRRHGFHTPTVCTADEAGAPQGRIVVLRGASESNRNLVFHTDARAAKCGQLSAGAAWVFYDAARKLQIRAGGPTALADGVTHDAYWARSSAQSRKCYLVHPAPGTPVGREWSGGFPADLDGAVVPDRARTEVGRAHFAVVQTTVEWLESLWLSRHGHQRARFTHGPQGWQGQWLVP